MTDTLRPRDAKDVEAVVQWALAEGKTLEIVGHGSKRAIGRPAQTDLTLDLSALTGVTLYEPEELVLSAKAGTPLAEIEALLAANGQQLAFEPMDYGRRPRRASAGAARSAACWRPISPVRAGSRPVPRATISSAFTAVSGRGETFKSGGRVVKNVTGYDLCKLMAGSWGTLAAMTDVTIKMLPRPKPRQTLLIRGLEPAAGGRGHDRRHGLVLRCVGRGAPAGGRRRAHPGARDRGGGRRSRRCGSKGSRPRSPHRKRDAARTCCSRSASLPPRMSEASRALWREPCATPLAVAAAQSPAERAAALAHLDRAEPGRRARRADRDAGRRRMLFDWAGGLIWADAAPPATMRRRRSCAGRCARPAGTRRSSARRPRSRAAIDVFAPQNAAVAALTKRVKESFDPKGVLNPGRMWAGV